MMQVTPGAQPPQYFGQVKKAQFSGGSLEEEGDQLVRKVQAPVVEDHTGHTHAADGSEVAAEKKGIVGTIVGFVKSILLAPFKLLKKVLLDAPKALFNKVFKRNKEQAEAAE